MSRSAIPGFIKKRTAAQQYRRSPRQITRDITIALEMRDESVLSHLRLRTEDGNTIEGNDLTPELIKQLRADGRNPMWYLRKKWLEDSYGLRGDAPDNGKSNSDDTLLEKEDELGQSHSEKEGIVGMMQESIRELKKDKELLTEQLRIKDQQILETTERWKESNYISQGLNQRLEAMEKRFEVNSQLLKGAVEKSTPLQSSEETELGSKPIAKPTQEKEAPVPKKKPVQKSRKRDTRKSTKSKTSNKPNPAVPKWYELPTFRKLLSRTK